MPDYKPGDEIPTRHKEAIRQLHRLAKFGSTKLRNIYRIAQSLVYKVLDYNKPECYQPGRNRRPRTLDKNNIKSIVQYTTKSYNRRVLLLPQLHTELELECFVRILEKRLKKAEYYCRIVLPKLYLTTIQAATCLIWEIAYLF